MRTLKIAIVIATMLVVNSAMGMSRSPASTDPKVANFSKDQVQCPHRLNIDRFAQAKTKLTAWNRNNSTTRTQSVTTAQ